MSGYNSNSTGIAHQADHGQSMFHDSNMNVRTTGTFRPPPRGSHLMLPQPRPVPYKGSVPGPHPIPQRTVISPGIGPGLPSSYEPPNPFGGPM